MTFTTLHLLLPTSPGNFKQSICGFSVVTRERSGHPHRLHTPHQPSLTAPQLQEVSVHPQRVTQSQMCSLLPHPARRSAPLPQCHRLNTGVLFLPFSPLMWTLTNTDRGTWKKSVGLAVPSNVRPDSGHPGLGHCPAS